MAGMVAIVNALVRGGLAINPAGSGAAEHVDHATKEPADKVMNRRAHDASSSRTMAANRRMIVRTQPMVISANVPTKIAEA